MFVENATKILFSQAVDRSLKPYWCKNINTTKADPCALRSTYEIGIEVVQLCNSISILFSFLKLFSVHISSSVTSPCCTKKYVHSVQLSAVEENVKEQASDLFLSEIISLMTTHSSRLLYQEFIHALPKYCVVHHVICCIYMHCF